MRDLLNSIYRPLVLKCTALVSLLKERGCSVQAGFYHGHIHQTEARTWLEDAYPIPVVTVSGLCDIELDFDRITVTAKLDRDHALAFSETALHERPVEIYGVADIWQCFDGAERRESMAASGEQEFFFSFRFPPAYAEQELLAFVEALRRDGFYYDQ